MEASEQLSPEGVCTGLASVTRGAKAEETGLKEAATETREAGFSTRFVGDAGWATKVFLSLFFFFFSCSTVEGGGGAEEDSISTSEGGREANGEAGGEGSERSNEGADPNQAPEEDEVDSSDISLKRKSDTVNILKPKNLSKALNDSKSGG